MNQDKLVDLPRLKVREAVYEAISDCLALEKESLNEDLRVGEDLNADSMDVVSMLLMLDASLGVEIDPQDLPTENVTVGWIIDELTAKSS